MVFRGSRDRLDLRDPKVRLELRVLLDLKVIREIKASLEFRVLKAHRESLVLRGLMEMMEIRV